MGQSIEELLRCPATHKAGFVLGPTEAFCAASGRRYPVERGVADLGPQEPPRPSLSQRAMEIPAVTTVYERYWRPAITRAATRQRVDESIALSLAMLRLEPGQTVVDLACGTGNFTRPIAGAVGPRGRVVGVDLSWPMLLHAEALRRREGLAQVAYLRGDAHNLPVADGVADAAHCAGALHLFPDPARAVAELGRVVRPGGRLVVATFVASRHRLMRRLQQASTRVGGFEWFTCETLYRALEAGGWVLREEVIEGTAIQIAAEREARPGARES